MLEIKNLTKVFISTKNEKCVALDNVSFNLPNKGFVFVVGKSGSGKTTLLSLLGALDNITSGDIIVDGISIKDLSSKDFAYYRNSKVGFIFQDYHLINDLTIFENVNLALKLQNKKDDQKVLDALKEVGLEGYASRFPKELSGGERQRVAIARSIIKNPSIILADEPTGNLDEKTTTQILDLLKEISSKHLVLIVSHDIIEARKYADRIIVLKEGKITSNLIRNNNYKNEISINKSNLNIPLFKEIDENDSKMIEKALENNEILSISQSNDSFIEKEDKIETHDTKNKIEKKHLKFFDNLKIGWKFVKKHLVLLSTYSLIITSLVCVMSLTQLISTYEPSPVISNELKKQNYKTMALKKFQDNKYGMYLNDWYSVAVTDNDKKAILDTNYKGNLYDIVESDIPLGDIGYTRFHLARRFDPSEIYEGSTYGTAIVNEKFLKTHLDLDKIELIETKKVIEKPYGIYITDYSADSLIHNSSNFFHNYDEIVGDFNDGDSIKQGYVNGIIKTNYKEKHKKAISKLEELTHLTKEISKDKDVIKFVDDVANKYSLNYTYNKNFREDYAQNETKQMIYKRSCKITDLKSNTEKDLKELSLICPSEIFGLSLNSHECYINYRFYNALFQTSYNINTYTSYQNEGKTDKIKLVFQSEPDYLDEKQTCSFELNIKGLMTSTYISLNNEDYKELLKSESYINGYLLDNLDNLSEIYDNVNERMLKPQISIVHPVTSMTRIIRSFSSLFYLLFVILLICSIALLMNYNLKSIKEKMKEIGILKAVGATNGDILKIFFLQPFLITFSIVILYSILSFPFISLANKIVVFSVVQFTEKAFLTTDFTLLLFKPIFLLYNSLIVVGITLISIIIPIIKLSKLKPLNIIKAKE